jgi:hypothetical protein
LVSAVRGAVRFAHPAAHQSGLRLERLRLF